MKTLCQIVTMLLVAAFVPAASVVAQDKAAPTADQAFEQLKRWDYDQPRQPLAALERYIGHASNDPAARAAIAEKLAAVLADAKASDGAKTFAATQLPLVAGEAQLPLLAKMAGEPRMCDLARLSLEAIPGEASLKVLRETLAGAKGNVRVGLINSLGNRRDAAAVEPLAALLGDEPPTALAAMQALGKIGTPAAGKALADAKVAPALREEVRAAQFRCAEQLAGGGEKGSAAEIYKNILAGHPEAAVQLAALAGLARTDPASAAPEILKAMDEAGAAISPGLLGIVQELPGKEITAALTARLAKLEGASRAVMIDALAQRGDRSAGPAVLACLDDKDEAVRAAAAKAMAELGDASCAVKLAEVASVPGPVQEPARMALARLTGAGVDQKILSAAREGAPAVRAELLRALASRRTAGASAVLLASAGDGALPVRLAAFESLAVLGGPEEYPKIVTMLAACESDTDAAARKAVLAVAGQLADVDSRTKPVIESLAGASASGKKALLGVLGSLGGQAALATVRKAQGDADETIRDAAIRALGKWPDVSAAGDLLALAKDSAKPLHRTLALQGFLRLAQETSDAVARMKMLEEIRPAVKTAEAKRLLLSALSETGSPAAVEMAAGYLGDAEVREEAILAVQAVGRLLAGDRRAVTAAMAAVNNSSAPPQVKKKALTLLEEAAKKPGKSKKAGFAEGKELVPDPARSELRKAELAKAAPKDFRLACYVDCGPETEDGAKGGPALAVVRGQPFAWPGSTTTGGAWYGTVAYDGRQVVVEARGLNPRKAYLVGLSWWDYDHGTREQSVWFSSIKSKNEVKALDRTKLPAQVRNEPPAEKVLPVPANLYRDGTLRIMFNREGEVNAVVCEVWLFESAAEGATAPTFEQLNPPASADKADVKPSAPAARPAKTAKARKAAAEDPAVAEFWKQAQGEFKLIAAKPQPGRTTKVLIVTGQDSHHKWQATTPVLLEQLNKDSRLLVDVSAEPRILASSEIAKYDAIVLHFVNGLSPEPGQKAINSLKAIVEGGKGLVVIHFACGAFQGNAEFRDLIGRAYDPKLRGHDPRGPFEVRATAVKHPITEGLSPFTTTDELYTCLAGEAKIDILAVATSKVDKKDYPMAYVLNCGKGRVFHCPLGHDVVALSAEGPGDLIRRGTAWAAGLAPVAK